MGLTGRGIGEFFNVPVCISYTSHCSGLNGMSHTLSSHTAQPIIHILLRSSTPNPVTPAVRDAPSFDIVGKSACFRTSWMRRSCSVNGSRAHARRLGGQELVGMQLSRHPLALSCVKCSGTEVGLLRSANLLRIGLRDSDDLGVRICERICGRFINSSVALLLVNQLYRDLLYRNRSCGKTWGYILYG